MQVLARPLEVADGDASFVAAMEDVLAVYCLPLDPLFPVVCMMSQYFLQKFFVRKNIAAIYIKNPQSKPRGI
jgi:hypothetical protein